MNTERRINRSENLHQALEHQLSASATRGAFETIILASHEGLLISAAGDDCEREAMAALSPTLASGKTFWRGYISSGKDQLAVSIKPIESKHGPMYLCAKGGISTRLAKELQISSEGISRILASQ